MNLGSSNCSLGLYECLPVLSFCVPLSSIPTSLLSYSVQAGTLTVQGKWPFLGDPADLHSGPDQGRGTAPSFTLFPQHILLSFFKLPRSSARIRLYYSLGAMEGKYILNVSIYLWLHGVALRTHRPWLTSESPSHCVTVHPPSLSPLIPPGRLPAI